MNKPSDYDKTTPSGESTPLPPGGYICKIMDIKEGVTRNGYEAIFISLDIAEGPYKDYFADRYRSDTRSDKKWGCVVTQLTYTTDGTNSTNRFFKGFITCVEKSNNGFFVQWGDRFCSCFKGKSVGASFGREEFSGSDGSPHFTTRFRNFYTVDRIKEGIKIPEDKLLENHLPAPAPTPNPAPASAPANDLSDFEDVISADDLPF